MKRTHALLLLLFILHLPFACSDSNCDDGNCNCGKSTGFEKATIETFGTSVTGSTNFTDAGILLSVNKFIFSENIRTNDFSFMNSAYACSLVPPSYQRISTLEITSNESVFSGSQEFMAGEKLNDLFYASFLYSDSISVDSIGILQEEYGEYGNWPVTFRLRSQPDQAIDQKFTFLLKMDDDAEYTSVSPDFVVN